MAVILYIIFLISLLGCDKDSSRGDSVSTQQSPQERLARAFAARSAFDVDFGVRISPLLKDLTKHTRYSCYRVNSEFDDGCLKFYFLRPHSIPNSDKWCGYAGNDAIFCDTSLLVNFVETLDGVSASRDELTSAFQKWVIGHEIGHADLGHSVGHFMTAPFPKTQAEAWSAQGMEYDADRRFIALAGDVPGLERLMVLLFNTAYRERYGASEQNPRGLNMDKDPSLQYPYVLSSSHPHMTIRTASLLLLVARTPELRNDAQQFILSSGGLSTLEERGLITPRAGKKRPRTP